MPVANSITLQQNQKANVMKRLIITLFIAIAAWQSACAMSYEKAREEALYLTDKMAYELNLNDQQYNDAYEINLDYFLSLNTERDLYEDYLSYRLSDFRHILFDWQYNLLMAADYFIRPVYWRSGGWYFSIYNYYNHGYYYYSYPTVYYSYRGGHGRLIHHHGFYADRRPVWNGGMRGHQPIGGRPNMNGRGSVTRERNGRISGNGYHVDLRGRNNERYDRGNSFGNSSTRNPRNNFSRRGGDENMTHGNSENMNPSNRNGWTGRNGHNSDRTSGNYGGGSRNYDSNSSYGGSMRGGTNGNFGESRGSGTNGSFGGSRGSGMSRGGYGGSRSSSMSGSFGGSRSSGMSGSFGGSRSSGMSRGGYGGSRGSNGGGGISRGRR